MNSWIRFSAPTDGSFLNVALFNSRYDTKACVITGGSDLVINGTVYCPTGLLEFAGNSVLSQFGVFSALIGYTINIRGEPNININFAAAGRASQFSEVTMVE